MKITNMLEKIKIILLLAIAFIALESVYILRMTDDKLTLDSFLKRENIVSFIILLIMAAGVSIFSGDIDDDE